MTEYVWTNDMYQTMVDRAVKSEAAARDAAETIERLTQERDAAYSTLLKIHDQAYRASLVQDRSVNIIKQVCRSISVDAKDAAHIKNDGDETPLGQQLDGGGDEMAG